MSFNFGEIVSKWNWWCYMVIDETPEEQMIIYQIRASNSLDQVTGLIAELEKGRINYKQK